MKNRLAVLLFIIFIFIVNNFSVSQQVYAESDRIAYLKTIELGLGARPEIVYSDNRFYVIYNSPVENRHDRCFKVKIFDNNFQKELTSKVLVSSNSTYGTTTDIRVAKWQDELYAVYEQAKEKENKSFLSVRKYKLNDKFSELTYSQKPLVTGAFWYKAVHGDELLDDPACIVFDNHLYVMTKIKYNQPSKAVYVLRKISTDVSAVLEEYKIDLSSVFAGPSSVSNLILYNGKLYRLGQSLVFGRPLAINLLMVELDAQKGYLPADDIIVLSNRHKKDTIPKGVKFNNGLFFLTHEEIIEEESGPPTSQRPGQLKEHKIWLRVYNSNFKEIASLEVSDDKTLGLHPTLEVVDNKIYVTYGHKGENSESKILIKIYEMHQE